MARPVIGGKDRHLGAEDGGCVLPTLESVTLCPLRRTRLLVAAATVLSGIVLSTGNTAHAFTYTRNCPKAETYVSKATWHRHTLMKGVVLSEGQARDSRGIVDMHVLTIDMTNTNIHFHPLMRHVAQRSPLSQLASGKSRLVAATNTGYFDFNIGAPYGPVVNRQQPVTGTTSGSSYIGIGSNHRVYTGKEHLAATVTANGVTRPLNGFNSIKMPKGLSLFTPHWGSAKVPVPWNGVSRYLVNGAISSKAGRYTSPPQPGQTMLVARGSNAVTWLKGLARGAKVSHHLGYTTDAPVKIVQGYQVGDEIVQKKGVVRTGLPCRTQYPMPARNAVGWTDRHRKMIIAIVTDKPGTKVHGLDEDQMSKLMVELGSSRAYLWDGSGSAEMIARMPSTGSLSIRNYTADGQERWMPVGFGIFRH
jgi:hypothetical protein